MKEKIYSIVDYRSKKIVEPHNFVFTGKDSPWEVKMDFDVVNKRINFDYFKKAPALVSKYLSLLPINDYRNFVSLSEGGTPLIKSKAIGPKYGIDLYFKVEGKNPTGSFKDRGSAVEISVAKELGVKAIVVASTGNMAASCACYAAAAGIPCFIFVPEDTPQTKLAQVISYGGKIVQIKGTYNDAAELAEKVAGELNFYLAGDYAFRLEGQKTAAYEIIDQLFFQVPDAILVPIGCGTNISAYAKGFEEYRALGLIESVPKVYGVQAEGASPVVRCVEKKGEKIEPFKSVNTVASAIAIGNPIDGEKALNAIYDTGGGAVAVTDAELTEAQFLLSHEEGLFVESSGGVSLASLLKLVKLGKFKDQKVVCILCGDGLKDTTSVLRVAMKPPTIFPEMDGFLSLYRSGFFEGSNYTTMDREQVIFASSPTNKEVEREVNNLLGVTYSDEQIKKITETTNRILTRGKKVTLSDFQDIIQDTLQTNIEVSERAFTVKDFEVQTGRSKKAIAKVQVEFFGEERIAEGTGVGPVDALINALREVCGPEMSFELKEYKVGIRSTGTDAVVFTETKLRKNGKISIGRGASPDIIEASIESFEHAYNGFA